MQHNTITLFMWGYQPYYRDSVESAMNSVMKELGVFDAGAECVLVGARIPGKENQNEVCVEPEGGKWRVELFNGLLAAVEAEVEVHPMQDERYYGDAPSTRDKPENIRRDSVRRAVQEALGPYDTEHQVLSFAGAAGPVGDYYVVPVVQLPAALFERFRPLREPVTDGQVTGQPSLIHAAVAQVLSDAHDELLRPEPGRFSNRRSRSPEEIVRRAAASFMRTPGIAIGDRSFGAPNLFERFNVISSLMYEGTEGTGRMLLANPAGGAVDVILQLAEPVPFREHRWSRKILQMASHETALVVDCEKVLGLGNMSADVDPCATQNVFEIEFLDHYHWRMSCGDEVLLVSRYGAPSLPQESFPRVQLSDTFKRLFPDVTSEELETFLALFDAAVEQRHGSMLVVAKDAEAEAERLGGQGTRIAPTRLTPELYRRVSGIDGTIIVDPHGVCHAIGVILDGPARPECTPSRGSRYNSGIRYVGASATPRLAVVVSDDRTVDVMPVLRPRIRRSEIEKQITKLESASRDNYHAAINWLDQHRFYLDQTQCDRVNSALARIHAESVEVGEITIERRDFSRNPNLNDDYFEKDEG